jgi:myo-inositol-1(or 4)-monophosphatase
MDFAVPSALSHPLLPVAIEAARLAIDVVGNPPPELANDIHEKGAKDFATGVDLESERRMRELFAQRTPSIPLLGEEGGGANLTDPIFWLADPLDGTLNFAFGNPLHGLNLALIEGGEAQIGITLLPKLNEAYIAVRGQGAWLNEKRFMMPDRAWGAGALSHGSPFSLRQGISRVFSEKVAMAAKGSMNASNVSASSVSLAWTARGIFALALYKNNNAWDAQAGALLVREAGGRVVDADGSEHTLFSKEMMAGSPRALGELMEAYAAAGLLRHCEKPGEA